MAFVLAVALQAAAPAPSPPAEPIDFRLARRLGRPILDGCGRVATDPDEILVCGRRGGGDVPVDPELAREYGPEPLRAEMSLGGGVTGRAYLESKGMRPGEESKRVMVGVKLPF